MAKANISKSTVDDAKPGSADCVVWDDKISGFGLKVTPKGGKVYFFRYRIAPRGRAAATPPTKYTIGPHGKITPFLARKRAEELAALVVQGIDPRKRELAAVEAENDAKKTAAEKARLEGELAFENVAARWLDHYENEGRRARTVDQARRIAKTRLEPALAGKPLPHITRADLQGIIDAIPVTNRAGRLATYAYASVLFR